MGQITKTNPKGAGAPSVMNKETEDKIEQILKVGGTIKEAVSYAGISERTYYTTAEHDENFSQKMKAAKHYADIMAKNVVVNSIVRDKDLSSAKWWLEKRQYNDMRNQINIQNNAGAMKLDFILDDRSTNEG